MCILEAQMPVGVSKYHVASSGLPFLDHFRLRSGGTAERQPSLRLHLNLEAGSIVHHSADSPVGEDVHYF